MTHHHCHNCGDAIPNGRAHIRSVSLEQVAFCGFCVAVRQGDALLAEMTPIPAQVKPSALNPRLRIIAATRQQVSGS